MIKETFCAEDTFELGRQTAASASPGDVIALSGDLGCGKTVFSQGFAAGLGIPGMVTSPTFTILQVYENGRLPLYHFDLYRIAEPEELYEIGFEEYLDGEGVTLIEWADLFPEMLPPDAISVIIRKDPSRGDDFREITVNKNGHG
jgi:tRNA threonylcarbamoyladenosine biosynthesis protein TsaE